MPDKDTVKPYVLLREALRKSGKIGIDRFVLRNREHLAVIKAYKKVIILNQLRYVDEIRTVHTEFKDVKVSAKEIDMAVNLIDQLTEEFHPEEHKDTYEEDLKRIIKQKAAGKKIKEKGKEPKKTKVHDLEDALKASLKQKKKRRKTA